MGSIGGIGSVGSIIVSLSLVVACGGDAGMQQQPVTFHKDIEPLLQKHCLGCHTAGNIAPFALLEYKDAKIFATSMASQTKAGLMPPWGAVNTSECTPPGTWKNDIRLTADEISVFQRWADAGAPEGDLKDAPPAYQPKVLSLANKDVDLKASKDWVTSGDKDQFRCFVLDPGLTAMKYVNGVFFVPGNKKVVHHAVMFTDPKGESVARAGSEGSYDCFGGPRVSNSAILGVWAPGGTPIELPSNIGTPLTAGTKIVLQIHYHPGGTTADPDRSTVQLRYSQARPDYVLLTAAVGNYAKIETSGDGLQVGPNDRTSAPEFRIPVNTKDHIERMQFTMPSTINGNPLPPVYLYGLMAHMHLAGVDERVTMERDGQETCLLQEPRWDFDWQRFYAYDLPISKLPKIQGGDKIKVRCTYDSTTQNAALTRAWSDAGQSPKDITLGEETFDEMCLMLPQLLLVNFM